MAAFWRPLDAAGPPLTDAALADAEALLGVRLPAALVTLLRVQNGGSVSEHASALRTSAPTSWSDDHVPFDQLLGIGGSLSLLDTPYLVEEWELPSPVVLVCGDGHWWIALDYRECGPVGEPVVTWFDADAETELRLAATFEDFLGRLTAPPPLNP